MIVRNGRRVGPDEDLIELYETAPCGFLSTFPDGLIAKANRTFFGWIGLAPEEVIGVRRFESLLTTPGRIYYQTHFAPLLRMQGFISEVALDLACADGRRLPIFASSVIKFAETGAPHMVRTTLFLAADRRRYEQELLHAKRAAEEAQAALRDLTASLEQRVAAEVENRLRAEEALRLAQKMEALGQLTGGVAHDFNNMLAIIAGGLGKIDRLIGAAPDHQAAHQLQRAHAIAMQGVERAGALTKRLLAFARRQDLQPQVVDVSRLVEGMQELLRQALSSGVALKITRAPETWPVFADVSELENALLNLTVNARDAMPDGGEVHIATANRSADTLPADVPERSRDYVLISVADTGAGMSGETLARALEPFFTTKGAGRGTGLGLSQVHGFIRQSGGHVRIESAVGAGTVVELYLPRAETPGHAGEETGVMQG